MSTNSKVTTKKLLKSISTFEILGEDKIFAEEGGTAPRPPPPPLVALLQTWPASFF